MLSSNKENTFIGLLGNRILKFLFELFIVVFGVYLGFMANNYSEDLSQKDYIKTTIKEMYQSIDQDIKDAEINKFGHDFGLKSVQYFSKMVKNQPVPVDSFLFHYSILTRSFVSIQNISPFEALKAKGLNLIKNDSLRTQIIKLYDFQYDILEKIEEKYQESQFYTNESDDINSIIDNSLVFDKNAKLVDIIIPLNITKEERNRLILILTRIKNGRNFNLSIYDEVIRDMKKVKSLIVREYPFVTTQ